MSLVNRNFVFLHILKESDSYFLLMYKLFGVSFVANLYLSLFVVNLFLN